MADFGSDLPEKPLDPIERELEAIEHLREHALENRDILYCSPIARHLVEKEIPRLMDIIRRSRRERRNRATASSEEWMQSLLIELRNEVAVVRKLLEGGAPNPTGTGTSAGSPDV